MSHIRTGQVAEDKIKTRVWTRVSTRLKTRLYTLARSGPQLLATETGLAQTILCVIRLFAQMTLSVKIMSLRLACSRAW